MKLSYETAALIADRYTGADQEFALATVLRRRGLGALTPEALREFVLTLGADLRFSNNWGASNRAMREAQAAENARAVSAAMRAAE